MFKYYFFGLIVILGLSPVIAAEPQKQLRVPHIADAAPFMIINEQQQPVAGLLFELYQRLSEQLGLTLYIEAVPRKLVGKVLLKGDIDLYCNAAPEWFPEPEFRWSPPLFIHRDVVVSRQYYPDIATFLQRAQGRIGTTYEYIYPTLSWLFQTGRLERVDNFSPRESLRLLQAGLLDTVVVSELELNYFLHDRQGLSSLVIAQDEIRCIYAPHLSDSQIQQFNAQFSNMVKRGELIRIIEKYQ